ncbi:MAG: hypothetical protein ACI9MC_001875 [Kiritimatiellia bacterium]|jgi:hypothetical protein
MIVVLATWAALAGPWSDDPSKPSDGWLLEGAQKMTQTTGDHCSLTPQRQPVPLPQGVRVKVWLADTPECAKPMLWASFDTDSWPREPEHGRFWIEASMLSAKAPHGNIWAKAKPVTAKPEDERRTGPQQYVGFVHSQNDWVIAQSLDHPDQPVTVFGGGDRVQVLALGEVGIFRLEDGRTFAVAGQRFRGTRDPIGRKPVNRRMRDRLLAGRTDVDKPHPIDVWPAQGPEDPNSRKGHTFVIQVHVERLSQPQYVDEWIDPVGQVLSPSCDGSTDIAEPCSPIYLDYSSFGAWLLVKEGYVLARLQGTKKIDGVLLPHLVVTVKDPFGAQLRISPGFDGNTIDDIDLRPQ